MADGSKKRIKIDVPDTIDQQPEQVSSQSPNPIEVGMREAQRLATNPIEPMLTKEASGVGQGAIQGATFGYGMPLLRKAIPGSEQIAQPTMKEELIGGLAGGAASGSGVISQAAKLGKYAPMLASLGMGYLTNPSNEKIEPLVSLKRTIGGLLGAGGQALGKTAQAGQDIVSPESISALTRGLKPGNTNLNFSKDADLALPIIKETSERINKPIKTIEDFIENTKEAKKNIWGKIQEALDAAEGKLSYGTKTVQVGETVSPIVNAQGNKIVRPVFKDIEEIRNGINGKDITDSMVNSIDPQSIKLSPEYANAIKSATRKYENKGISIAEAEDKMEKINANLSRFFKSSSRNQYIKGQDEDIAAQLIERKVLRQTLNDKIEKLTGENVAPLKKSYGALMNLQDEALKRVIVSNRQMPLSLQEQINGVLGITRMASGDLTGAVQLIASQGAKVLNSSNRLVSQAVKNVGKYKIPFNYLGKALSPEVGRQATSNYDRNNQ